VLTSAETSPAFGEADLSNCEREQIHLAGSIQPHGSVLLLREPDNIIVQASDNAAAFLGLQGSLIGRRLDTIHGDLAQQLRPHLDDPLVDVPRAVRCRVGQPALAFDGLIHRPPGGGLMVELERAGPRVDLSRHLEKELQTIIHASSLQGLCDATAKIFKTLTGYDRVMVYRFDVQGHGEVYAEQRKPTLEPYLGNRYPASDIPHIARRLYERNRVRVLVDVTYAPVPLTPVLSPISGKELDMSLCFLRSSSPIHVQYLKNMGVRATLVVSLLVNGKLWGLISCHHYVPRFVHFEERAVCELLAEAVATRISALESFARAQAELSVRRLEHRMIQAISQEGDWRGALFDGSKALLDVVGATGAAMLFENEILTAGEVPGTRALRELGRWLDQQEHTGVISTNCLGLVAPAFELLTTIASGILAAPISTAPGEYLIWLRPERVHTVTWGGNPFKPAQVGDDPKVLSPRRSFAQWHQVVEGSGDPWSDADLSAARLIGDTVKDVIIQFRSVRLLLAEDQLNNVRRQVEQSDQPVVIADVDGTILKMNAAFLALLPEPLVKPTNVIELAPHFTDPDNIRDRLDDALKNRRPWREEVRFKASGKRILPLLVRADPVFTAPDRSVGLVMLLTDLTEREAAAAARRGFQETLITQRPSMSGWLDTKADLVFRNIQSVIVENAQLAALEIADRVEPARMPQLLEALRASVTRTAEVLSHLVWHTSRRGVAGRRKAVSNRLDRPTRGDNAT
jgi:two-component system, chemotaxis family, sensor kinase Cph1